MKAISTDAALDVLTANLPLAICVGETLRAPELFMMALLDLHGIPYTIEDHLHDKESLDFSGYKALWFNIGIYHNPNPKAQSGDKRIVNSFSKNTPAMFIAQGAIPYLMLKKQVSHHGTSGIVFEAKRVIDHYDVVKQHDRSYWQLTPDDIPEMKEFLKGITCPVFSIPLN